MFPTLISGYALCLAKTRDGTIYHLQTKLPQFFQETVLLLNDETSFFGRALKPMGINSLESMMAIRHIHHCIMFCSSQMVIMDGTVIYFIACLLARPPCQDGDHRISLKRSIYPSVYILALVNTLPSTEVGDYFSSMLLICGHRQIKHVSLISGSTKANSGLLCTVAWKIG